MELFTLTGSMLTSMNKETLKKRKRAIKYSKVDENSILCLENEN
jgi:hypothetical protein